MYTCVCMCGCVYYSDFTVFRHMELVAASCIYMVYRVLFSLFLSLSFCLSAVIYVYTRCVYIYMYMMGARVFPPGSFFLHTFMDNAATGHYIHIAHTHSHIFRMYIAKPHLYTHI